MTTKWLDELSPRLQGFRIRLLQYGYTIGHVPGKAMYTANVLSRKPLPDTAFRTRELNTKEYELLTPQQLPASQEMVDRIKNKLKTNSRTYRVIVCTLRTWPDIMTLPRKVRQFQEVASELAIIDDL